MDRTTKTRTRDEPPGGPGRSSGLRAFVGAGFDGKKAHWLGLIAAAAIVGCVTYCYFVWEWPAVPTLAEPDVALTCWLFCGTLKPEFAAIALASGLSTGGIALALKRGRRVDRRLTTSLGILTLPIGLLLILANGSTEDRGARG